MVPPIAAPASPSAAPSDEVETSTLLCPPRTIHVNGGTRTVGKKQVAVREYCMDVTEVTAGAYAECVDRGACNDSELECDDQWTFRKPGRADHPINCVSWQQADGYCRAVGKRLPTFDEWEWAAQAGSEKRRFAWGDSEPAPGQICWSEDTAQPHTCVVGTFPSSRTPDGIDDLFGGVWEYLSPAQRNGIVNVSRGGSWQNTGVDTLEGDNPGGFMAEFTRNDVVGFRCAYDGKKAPPPPRPGRPSRDPDAPEIDLDEP